MDENTGFGDNVKTQNGAASLTLDYIVYVHVPILYCVKIAITAVHLSYPVQKSLTIKTTNPISSPRKMFRK